MWVLRLGFECLYPLSDLASLESIYVYTLRGVVDVSCDRSEEDVLLVN